MWRATPSTEFTADLRYDGEPSNPSDPASGYVGPPDLNEFTLFGESWSEATLIEWFLKMQGKHPEPISARHSARAVWAFIQAVADEQVDKDDLEEVG